MFDKRFQQAEDQYFSLKGQLAAGRISREQFDAALKQLMVQDAQGRYWMIGPDTGKWYIHDGHTWVEAQPGGNIYAPYAPPPIQVQPRGVPGVTGLLIAAGIVVGVLLIGAIAVFFASSQGLLKIGLSGSINTPNIAMTPAPTVAPPPTAIVIVVTPTPASNVVLPSPAPTLPPPTATLTPTVSAADLVAQADVLTFQSKFDDAAALYQRAIDLDGNNALAYAHWARLLDYRAYLEMRDDMFIQAVKKAQTAGQLAPNDPEVSVWMARAYDWSEIYDKALTTAQKAVQLAPNSAEAFAVLAEAELDNQKLADAERDALKAVQINPNAGEAHRILGYILNEKKQSPSAIAEFEKAAQLDPNLTVRHFEMGAMYRSAGNLGQATAALERSITLYPRSARAYASLGMIYRDQKLYDKSIESFNAAIQVNDQICDFYFDLGQSHLAAGHLSAAMDAAQRGIAIDPNNQNIKNLLVAIARAQGTPVPPTAGAAAPTPAAPPGIYVTAVRTDPPEVKHGQLPTFQVTFLNTLGITANYNWFVKIFEPDRKQSSGETAKSASSIPPGSNPFASFANWKATGSTPCHQFIARVFYVAPDNTIVEFPKPGGDSFWYYFPVCQ